VGHAPTEREGIVDETGTIGRVEHSVVFAESFDQRHPHFFGVGHAVEPTLVDVRFQPLDLRRHGKSY